VSLDHAHAEALLAPGPTLAALAEEVDAAAAGLRLRLIRADVDLDVPVPLVLEVDALSELRLVGQDGEAVGALYLHVRGEAYDRRYRVVVRLVAAESRTLLDDGADPAAWSGGLAALARRLGQPVPAAALVAALIAATPPALRDVVRDALAAV
jgi:hypothetical protein